MLKFIQIFLSTVLALCALGMICILAIPFVIMFWPIIILALPIALIIYLIQLLEKINTNKNKKIKRSK